MSKTDIKNLVAEHLTESVFVAIAIVELFCILWLCAVIQNG